MSFLIEVLKTAANNFVKANRKKYIVFSKNNLSSYIFFQFLVSFDKPSTFALSIYSLFYLLYSLYPNNLRRELQTEPAQPTNSNDRLGHPLGIERVLLVSYNKKSEFFRPLMFIFSHFAIILNFTQVLFMVIVILKGKKIVGKMNLGNNRLQAVIV